MSPTYVHVDGTPPLTFGAWLDAVRDERTFGTNGPLLFLGVGHPALDPQTMVDPGGEIILETADDTTLNVRLAVASMAPLERVEIIVNGAVAHTWEATDFAADRATGAWQLTTSIELAGSGWIAARAAGPPGCLRTQAGHPRRRIIPGTVYLFTPCRDGMA